MKPHTNARWAVLTGAAIAFGAGAAMAGEPPPYMPPPPPDCSGCVNPGFYLNGSLSYLNSYASDTDNYDGDWDIGFRGALGYETPSGLFFELSGFYYDGDFSDGFAFDPSIGSIEHFYVDLVVGDTLHCGEYCVTAAAGLRYASLELSRATGGTSNEPISESFDFDGIGPVFKLEVERPLNDMLSFYGQLSEALVFGEADGLYFNSPYTTDTLASITEIGLGLQFDITDNCYVRAGVEGQYWLVDSSDHGLWGGVLEVGGSF